MENFESHQNTSEYLEASKNWKEKGSLGVTAQDHEAISSTPDDVLVENPGKTLGELMTDQEISEFISGTRNNISENEVYPHLKRHNESLQKNLDVTIQYLKSIGRLPEDFV